MAKILLIGFGIFLVLGGLSYLIYAIRKKASQKQNNESINQKGMFAALAAIILGIFIIYKNSKKE